MVASRVESGSFFQEEWIPHGPDGQANFSDHSNHSDNSNYSDADPPSNAWLLGVSAPVADSRYCADSG